MISPCIYTLALYSQSGQWPLLSSLVNEPVRSASESIDNATPDVLSDLAKTIESDPSAEPLRQAVGLWYSGLRKEDQVFVRTLAFGGSMVSYFEMWLGWREEEWKPCYHAVVTAVCPPLCLE